MKKLKYNHIFLLLAAVLGVAGVLFIKNNVSAAPCTPGAGLGTLTRTNVSVNAAGNHKVWVRMQAGNNHGSSVGVEVRASGGTANCLTATGTSVNGWEWKDAGTFSASKDGNTIKLVGVMSNVKVDRVILVPANANCTPSNSRNTKVNPVQEPGDNCLTSTPVNTNPPGGGPTPPPPPPPPPPVDNQKPSKPSNLKTGIIFDWSRFGYAFTLDWADSTDNVGVKDYVVKRDGSVIGQPTIKSDFKDGNIVANRTYKYEITARDAAGNVSDPAVTNITGRCSWFYCWKE